MKKMVLTAAAAIFATWSVGAFADHVGVVDMKAIFTSSPKVKEIKAQLEKQFDPQNEHLQKMAQALQLDVQNYQKNKTVMNKKELSDAQEKITKQEDAFREGQSQFQQDIFKAQNDQLQQFMESVKSAVAIVAKKDQLDLVIPSNDVLYTKDTMDITKAVLENLK